MGTMTRRSLLAAGAAAGAGAVTAGLIRPGTARAARTKNLLLVGQNGNLNLVTPGGSMLMYYHNDWQYGRASFIGPNHHGDGFNGFNHLASTGVAYTYDNLYIGVNGSGVYGYYWHQGALAYANGGAGIRIADSSWSGWGGLKFLISGGYDDFDLPGSTFYTIDTSGWLYWHKYLGIPGQGGVWAPRSGLLIGAGWQNFSYVTAGPNGTIWAVDAGGTMFWYRYEYPHRAQDVVWHRNSAAVVGSGWRGGSLGYQTVQSGGVYGFDGGYLYMVDKLGNLRWNKHQGWQDGSPRWLDPTNGGAVIGTGWM
jgi:hypothetical protein